MDSVLEEDKAKDVQTQEEGVILEIFYYTSILIGEETHPIYLVSKQIDGKIVKEIRTDKQRLASIDENGIITQEPDSPIDVMELLESLQTIQPVSQKERNQQEEYINVIEENSGSQKQKVQAKKEVKQPIKQEEEKNNFYDAEIDIHQKITEDRNFADLVPEIKEKKIKQVKVKRMDATNYQIWGIDQDGNEMVLKSLIPTQGTNPQKEINQINYDGSKVEKSQVSSMYKIMNGTNEQNQNEGFTFNIGNTGEMQVMYYRRARGENQYTSIPVHLKDTNQKYNRKQVREFAEKRMNPDIDNNIDKEEEILKQEDQTSIEQVDDNPYNDKIEEIDYVEKLIEDAAKRCKMSVKAFRMEVEEQMEAGKADTLREAIEKTEEEINRPRMR